MPRGARRVIRPGTPFPERIANAPRRAGRGAPASVIPEDLRRGGVRRTRCRRGLRRNARNVSEIRRNFAARAVNRPVARTLLHPAPEVDTVMRHTTTFVLATGLLIGLSGVSPAQTYPYDKRVDFSFGAG